MEIKFTTQKNNVDLDVYRSYPSAFQHLCELIEKEHSSLKYINKSNLSKEEYKKVEGYYLNDGLYAKEEKVFGFGSFSFEIEKDTYFIKNN